MPSGFAQTGQASVAKLWNTFTRPEPAARLRLLQLPGDASRRPRAPPTTARDSISKISYYGARARHATADALPRARRGGRPYATNVIPRVAMHAPPEAPAHHGVRHGERRRPSSGASFGRRSQPTTITWS